MSDIGPLLDDLAPFLAAMVAEASKGAVRATPTSMYLPASVVAVDVVNRLVTCAPDGLAVGTQLQASPLGASPKPGDRVMLLLQPPSGVFVIGTISEPSVTADIAHARSVFLKPSAALFETYTRADVADANTAVLVSQRLEMVAIPLPAGVPINSITFVSGTTALVTGVNQWFALFDANLVQLGITADDAATAWLANTPKTLALTGPVTPSTSALYYLGIMVRATTVPSLLAGQTGAVIGGLPPILHGSADAGLTNPASCPATATALTARVGIPYAYVS